MRIRLFNNILMPISVWLRNQYAVCSESWNIFATEFGFFLFLILNNTTL